MDKYVIINESKLLRRIEELEINISICILPEQQNLKNLLEQELEIKKEILLHSTPLIPEVKKAFESQTEIKKYGTFRAMLSGHLKNKTNYKYY